MPDELLDVVNDLDVVTSQAMRSAVHEKGLQHRGVHAFLFTPKGNLLIQKRSADRSQYPSLWDCSISEHVKAGESYREAAERGLLEELGLNGIELQPLVSFQLVYGPKDNEISTLFRGMIDPGTVRFDPGEIERIAFCPIEELIDLMENGELQFTGWFILLMRWYTHRSSELQVLETWV